MVSTVTVISVTFSTVTIGTVKIGAGVFPQQLRLRQDVHRILLAFLHSPHDVFITKC